MKYYYSFLSLPFSETVNINANTFVLSVNNVPSVNMMCVCAFNQLNVNLIQFNIVVFFTSKFRLTSMQSQAISFRIKYFIDCSLFMYRSCFHFNYILFSSFDYFHLSFLPDFTSILCVCCVHKYWTLDTHYQQQQKICIKLSLNIISKQFRSEKNKMATKKHFLYVGRLVHVHWTICPGNNVISWFSTNANLIRQSFSYQCNV